MSVSWFLSSGTAGVDGERTSGDGGAKRVYAAWRGGEGRDMAEHKRRDGGRLQAARAQTPERGASQMRAARRARAIGGFALLIAHPGPAALP